MELKAYLRAVITRWWIVLPTFLVTFLAALLLTVSQKPAYEATATYVVSLRVSPLDDRASLTALATLREPEITGTFVQLSSSRLIMGQAAREIGLADSEYSDITVNSRAVLGTNLIDISAESQNPALARDFASAVGRKTAEYVRGLYGTYELQLVDEPTLPKSPVRPKVLLNLLVGALTGMLLGAGLAILSAYLTAETPAGPAVVDSGLMPALKGRTQPLDQPAIAQQEVGQGTHRESAEEGSGAIQRRGGRVGSLYEA